MSIPNLHSLETGKKLKFSGHQTFVFRYGWLEKGVKASERSEYAFAKDDAIVELGVGKNMVDSIKHWCQATQLIEPIPAPKAKANATSAFRPTPLAQKLFLDPAWDPFLEDDASLWLIHWHLVSNPHLCTTWQLAFGYFQRPDFSKRELMDFLRSFAEKNSVRIRDSSLSRDVDCFLRTYLAARNTDSVEIAEDTFECPLQELGIIQAPPKSEFCRFAIGPKPSLPPAIVAFALDTYFKRTKADRNLMSVQDCLYGAESPGQAFKLDENTLVEYIEILEDMTKGAIAFHETAGIKQIFLRKELKSADLLASYYGGNKE